MSLLSWLSPKVYRLEREKKELKAELTHAIVAFERKRGEVEQVAQETIRYMNARRSHEK